MNHDTPALCLLNNHDRDVLRAATAMLAKLMAATQVSPAEKVSIAKLQHVIARLPRLSDRPYLNLTVSSPKQRFDEIETHHWWEITLDSETIQISSGGHFYRPSSGGDTFTIMTWGVSPGEESDFSDYLADHWIVPDACSFQEGVAGIDLSEKCYSISITDEENTLLDEGEDDDEGDDDVEEEIEEEEPDEEGPPGPIWPQCEINPVDAVEAVMARQINQDEVQAHEPTHAHGADQCDSCACSLSLRGLFVDGKTRGDFSWANMCIPCFNQHGEGIGWGQGQLYAKQSDGSWRLAAGFDPNG